VGAEMESQLLREHGHAVECYRQSNDAIKEMSNTALAWTTIWSSKSADDIAKLCDSFRPDLIHVHNTFPLISPALYWLATARKIPIVQTLHNFRLLCPQAMFLRDGKNCEDCLGRLPWRAVTRKCYRDSGVQSGLVASMLMIHRAIGTYRDKVTSYIAPSEFSRKKFIAAGFAKNKIHVKPNFVVGKEDPVWTGRSGGLFVGRLSPEKGLDTLIDAMKWIAGVRQPGSENHCIKVVGAGPMEHAVRKQFGDCLLGAKSSAEVFNLLRSARYVVVPSTCYETFGLVAIEAFSCGVAVIASNHGALGELIDDGVTGLLFVPGDAIDLAKKITWANDHPAEMLAMGRRAYARYLKNYTAQENYKMLMEIYGMAISSTRRVINGNEKVISIGSKDKCVDVG